MITKFKTYEKIIFAIQILFGITISIFSTYSIYMLIETLTCKEISFLKLIKNYHSTFLISILLFVSAILAIKSNPKGWLLSIASWFALTLGISWNAIKKSQVKNFDSVEIFFNTTIIIIFFSFILLLFMKEFRNKYNPTKKDYLFLVSVIALLTIDNLFLR